MKYITKHQLKKSFKALENVHPFYGITFLACKTNDLPIGRKIEFPIDKFEHQLLEKYYKPEKNTERFLKVFRVSDKSNYWLRPDYPSSGSQKTRTNKFKDAFLHPMNTQVWGWASNYIEILKLHLHRHNQIPAFHLAVWLYRDREWKDETTARSIIDIFMREFKITNDEKKELFDTTIPEDLDLDLLFQAEPVSWSELSEELGIKPPPDRPMERGGNLFSLDLSGIGPAKSLEIKLSNRINLFTGDNGLGKSFILDCAWWALSGDWSGNQAYPREDAKKSDVKIKYKIQGKSGRPEASESYYDWKQQIWTSAGKRLTMPGLLIYARIDGAFAVWDPARYDLLKSELQKFNALIFSREDVWNGLPYQIGGTKKYLCNGLINDWVQWQYSPEEPPFSILKKVLRGLSPPNLSKGDIGFLEPGKPTRIPPESRLIPTIKHPYGEIPLIYSSAAVQRIVGLAYLIVWTWEEHKNQAKSIREKPQDRMVLLVDEIEAHLHPQWQRLILPALLNVLNELEKDLQVQLLITTHSPLVMTSIEPIFDTTRDKIFHLNLVQEGLFEGRVEIEEPEFVRWGSVNSWLRSNIFEVHPTSIEAENAMEKAKKLQLQKKASKEEIEEVSDLLSKYLSPHDPFWIRWTYFAKNHNVEL
ncbi:MAG: AAA family ATPase [Calditrichaceae bacterium]|nr:ATP-binding protein [Calditrichia bacterium]NUQ42831.1 AAA family ATPase [Calditrichaceae bacterium]